MNDSKSDTRSFNVGEQAFAKSSLFASPAPKKKQVCLGGQKKEVTISRKPPPSPFVLRRASSNASKSEIVKPQTSSETAPCSQKENVELAKENVSESATFIIEKSMAAEPILPQASTEGEEERMEVDEEVAPQPLKEAEVSVDQTLTPRRPRRPSKGRRSSILVPRLEESIVADSNGRETTNTKKDEYATLLSDSVMKEPDDPISNIISYKKRLNAYEKSLEEEKISWDHLVTTYQKRMVIAKEKIDQPVMEKKEKKKTFDEMLEEDDPKRLINKELNKFADSTRDAEKKIARFTEEYRKTLEEKEFKESRYLALKKIRDAHAPTREQMEEEIAFWSEINDQAAALLTERLDCDVPCIF
ncbi:unnamed protein product [Caenorhabditis auriculariae]|uniref:Uncharacterized protein n=1 Tax=Caenorhabditis auriculariae TaxID=2777116 RepID=A0A8S1GS19_9PELO|nr:unnamed protein product [Caenorhabditis auriculariae]